MLMIGSRQLSYFADRPIFLRDGFLRRHLEGVPLPDISASAVLALCNTSGIFVCSRYWFRRLGVLQEFDLSNFEMSCMRNFLNDFVNWMFQVVQCRAVHL